MALSPLDGANAFLEQFDPYIRKLVRRKVPRNVIPTPHIEDEIDEIAQKTRIKLWRAFEKGPINNPKAYINTTVYTEVVDMVRRYRQTSPFPVNDDEEFSQRIALGVLGQTSQNPSEILEQTEAATEVALWLPHAICSLPSRQQYALLWGLKKQMDDVWPVIAILNAYNVDVDQIDIVQKTEEKQRLSVLLSLARKKLRQQYKSRPILVQHMRPLVCSATA
jgi:DNA-directed RNA polymerase specialized sigma24 family protein